MLYWHLGLKRTGTTSLQTALVTHERLLASAGVVYPAEWRVSGLAGLATHQGLVEVFAARGGDDPAVRGFEGYLHDHADDSVLLSSEFVGDWLAGGKLEFALRAFERARAVVPVRCIWTLRRFDEMVGSHRLRRALLGRDLVPPTEAEASELIRSFAASLAGMRRVEAAAGSPATYLKYAASGAHNAEILSAMELPAVLRRPIEAALADGPRLNRQLTHKGAIAMVCRDEIAERLGRPIDRSTLQRALFVGDFEFEDDGPCELMGGELRAKLHEGALGAARECGMSRYVDFFDADRIESGTPVALDAGILTDRDIRRLAEHLEAPEQADIDRAVFSRYGRAGGDA